MQINSIQFNILADAQKKYLTFEGMGQSFFLRPRGWVTQFILFAGDGSLKIPGSRAKIHRPIPRVIYGHSLTLY